MAPKKGSQTPTTAVTLPYKKSRGKEAVDLYKETGRKALPWQVKQIKHILAVDKAGLYVHMNYGLEVPRRNGKNEVIAMRELYGLKKGERICHTAHRTTTSNSAFRRLYQLLNDAGYQECSRKKKKMPEKSFFASKQYGLESIILTGGGSIYFRTRTNNGGLGEGFDLLVIDEAQEYTEKQQSALVYTVSDSPNPQTIFTGTPPTAISAGNVFPKMRNQAIEGRLEATGWAEWSLDELPPDPLNVELWRKTNPSFGYILSERNVKQEFKGDAIDFGIQRLGVWVQYNQKSVFSPAEWDELKAPTTPELQKERFLAVKFGKDGKNVALSVAAKTRDGRIFVETIDCSPIRAGNGWLYPYFHNPNLAAVAVDGQNGQRLLAEEMEKRGFIKPTLPTVAEVVTAGALFEQKLYAKALVHCGQKTLREIVTHCDHRPIGSNGGFGYRSIDDGLDVAVLDSAVLAVWLASTKKAVKKQRIRY
jgi:phage terminase large subunit-like protein